MEYSDNLLKRFLLISVIAHGLFLLSLPRMNTLPFRKHFKSLEISYQKNVRVEETLNKNLVEKVEKRIAINKEIIKTPQEIKKASNPPAYAEGSGEAGKKTGVARIKTPVILEKSLAGVVAYPEAASPFMKNPAYMSYYEIIREKIKAVASLNSPLISEGEVYMTFVLDSNGQLKALKLIDEKSVPDNELRQLAYNFVEQASPFPPFPKDLKHQQLSFNVIIEFRLGD